MDNNGPMIVGIVTAICSLIAVIFNGVITYFLARLNMRASNAELKGNVTDKKLDHVAEKVEEVHLATNSMKDQLVEATRVAAHAQGMTDQKKADTKPGSL